MDNPVIPVKRRKHRLYAYGHQDKPEILMFNPEEYELSTEMLDLKGFKSNSKNDSYKKVIEFDKFLGSNNSRLGSFIAEKNTVFEFSTDSTLVNSFIDSSSNDSTFLNSTDFSSMPINNNQESPQTSAKEDILNKRPFSSIDEDDCSTPQKKLQKTNIAKRRHIISNSRLNSSPQRLLVIEKDHI